MVLGLIMSGHHLGEEMPNVPFEILMSASNRQPLTMQTKYSVPGVDTI